LFGGRHFRTTIAAIVLIAVGHTGSAQTASPSDNDAIAALQQGNFAQAIADADHALRQNPGNCKMLTIRGLALKDSGKINDGLNSFKKAAVACPNFLPAIEGMAEIQYARHLPGTTDTLNKILAIQPENATSHAMLAVLNWEAGRCEQAVEHFAKAGSIIQSNSTAQVQYGACLLALGDNEQAVEKFQELLAYEDTTENRLRYAYACWKARKYSEASAALEPLTEASNPNPQALTLAAQVAESAGDTPQAVKLLRSAILVNPNDPKNYLIFADISFAHDSFQVGIDMLNAGLQELPDAARLYVARGVLEVQLSKADAAMADFHQAHRLDPQLSLAEDAMGIFLSQGHQISASLAVYARQAKSHPDDAFVQYLYAEALRESDNSTDKQVVDTAISAARRAVELEPDYQPARDLLCILELSAGNLNVVIQQSEEALRRNPDDESALYQEMMAYRRLGKKSETEALADRLKEIHHQQQGAKMNYQLREITASGQGSP
jgi:tetratricopeptide (TPR) repeat protein